jgi:TatD DNase family protein
LFVDTHCHLDFEAFNDDRPDTLSRARQKGLFRILNPGVDLESSREAVRLSENYSEVYAAVGVHPNEAGTWNSTALDELRHLATSPKVVAIGEIGLDYYRNRSSKEEQRKILIMQLGLALELKLPVIIHTRNISTEDRKATADILDILVEWMSEIQTKANGKFFHPGVMHSFSDNTEAAIRATEINMLVGISGVITFHNARELQRVVSLLPIDALVIETDTPFLTPHPFRGKRNEPANVYLIAEKIAQLKNMSLVEVAEITTENAERLFRWHVKENLQ